MKSYSNIEAKKNNDGSYTGYDSSGRSWQITGMHGYWNAMANVTQIGFLNIIIGCKTLQEMSDSLKEAGK